MSKLTPSTLDRRLTDALRGDAGHAPMPGALLQVPDAWVRGRRLLRRSGRAAALGGVVTLAAVTTLAVLAVVGALGERGPSVGSEDPPADVGVPIETLDLEPRPVPLPEGGAPAIGPVMEVARVRAGEKDFYYTVYRAEAPFETELGGVCVFVGWYQTSGGGCGAMPGEDTLGTSGDTFGMGSVTSGSLFVHEVSGIVVLHAAEVWVETDTGGRAKAALIPLDAVDLDAQLFVAFLPGGVESSAWVALDADGNVIGRFETPPGPPEGPDDGPIPTPAAAP